MTRHCDDVIRYTVAELLETAREECNGHHTATIFAERIYGLLALTDNRNGLQPKTPTGVINLVFRHDNQIHRKEALPAQSTGVTTWKNTLSGSEVRRTPLSRACCGGHAQKLSI